VLGTDWVCLCKRELFVKQQQGQTMLEGLVAEEWSIGVFETFCTLSQVP